MNEQESNMRVVIRGGCTLSGEVKAPPSKSYSHRVLICSAFSEGESRIMKLSLCDDILATISVLRGMGAKIKVNPDTFSADVQGTLPIEPETVLFCSESASTLRMCLPLAASQEFFSVFSGEGSLIRRPVGPILEALSSLGVDVRSRRGYIPVALDSKGFSRAQVSISASFGSQHISGLLLSSTLSPHGMRIDIIDEAASKPYIDLTIDVMQKFGAVVKRKGYEYFEVKPGQRYKGCDLAVPGDYSSASFLIAAAISTRSKLSILDLPKVGFPDSQLLDVLRNSGAELQVELGRLLISGKSLRGIDADCRDMPDLVPALAAIAFFAESSSRLRGVSRLSLKESSRAKALVSEFRKMGGRISIEGEDLVIQPSKLHGCTVSSWGDHRIEMALAVAGLGADGETIIEDAMKVSKSYPGFYKDLENLGADIDAGQ